jgi:hypothetical protein
MGGASEGADCTVSSRSRNDWEPAPERWKAPLSVSLQNLPQATAAETMRPAASDGSGYSTAYDPLRARGPARWQLRGLKQVAPDGARAVETAELPQSVSNACANRRGQEAERRNPRRQAEGLRTRSSTSRGRRRALRRASADRLREHGGRRAGRAARTARANFRRTVGGGRRAVLQSASSAREPVRAKCSASPGFRRKRRRARPRGPSLRRPFDADGSEDLCHWPGVQHDHGGNPHGESA